MSQTWPSYDPNNLTFNGILLFGLHDPPVKILTISGIQQQRYCRNSQNMALIWPEHGHQYGSNKSTLKSILIFGMCDSLVTF